MAVEVSIGSVRSSDGTTIGYRQVGAGPGVVLLHGGMQTSLDLMTLAGMLADGFRVTVPDRRGRGLSGPASPDHGLDAEVEDLRSVLDETGATNVFGLSAGGVVALATAMTMAEISRLALYEPPLSFGGPSPSAWVPRYRHDIERGRLASAFVDIIKGTADGVAIRLVPRCLLVPLMSLALRADRRTAEPGAVPIAELIPTMRSDSRTIGEGQQLIPRFSGLSSEVLLLGGARSARPLRAGLAGLGALLPQARRVILPRVGHLAADNSGRPELVGAALRVFFRPPATYAVRPAA
jgi:pimeloyl-ACP methyl ester carboxylesterase